MPVQKQQLKQLQFPQKNKLKKKKLRHVTQHNAAKKTYIKIVVSLLSALVAAVLTRRLAVFLY